MSNTETAKAKAELIEQIMPHITTLLTAVVFASGGEVEITLETIDQAEKSMVTEIDVDFQRLMITLRAIEK